MIIISIDFSINKIGLAVGNDVFKTGEILKTINLNNKKINWLLISDIINTWKPGLLLVGFPLDLNGLYQYTTILVLKFINKLEKFKIPIKLLDERYTTVDAIYYLKSEGKYKKFNKNLDSFSALIILHHYFEENYFT